MNQDKPRQSQISRGSPLHSLKFLDLQALLLLVLGERARAAVGLGGRAGQRDPEGLASYGLATPPPMGEQTSLQFPTPVFSLAAPQDSSFSFFHSFFFSIFSQTKLVKSMKSVSSWPGTRLVLHLPT